MFECMILVIILIEISPGVSSVAKGYSSYVDSIFDNKMSQAFKSFTAMDVMNRFAIN